jgi:tetratricopeptide (TPR) repeat protein
MQPLLRHPLTAPLAAALLAAAAQLASLGHGLVWDDPLVIRHLLDAADAGGLGGVLRAEYLVAEPTGYWRPIVLLSLWTDQLLGGGAPWVFHLTNLLLHAGVAALGAVVCRRFLADSLAVLLAALLFAVHPTHVESTAFVSGRTDLWAALFCLAATLAWLRARDGVPRARLLFGLLWMGGLLSKEVAFLLPAPLLAADLALARADGDARAWRRRNLAWLTTAAAALALALGLRLGLAGLGFGAPDTAAGCRLGVTLGERLGRLPLVLAWYLKTLAFPLPLSAFWGLAALRPGPWLAWAAGAPLIVLLAGARRPAVVFGVVWLLAFLAPVLGVVPVAGAPVAERFLLLPSLGWCLLLGAWLGRSAGTRWGLPHRLLFAALVCLFAAATVRHAPVWRDEPALYADMAARSPTEHLPRYDLGISLQRRGDFAGAQAAFAAAVELEPAHAPSWQGLGIARGRLDDLAGAEAALRRAVAADPRLAEARYNLGAVLLHRGDLGAAGEAFCAALALRPDYDQARASLVETLVRAGDVPGARRELDALRAADPDLADAVERRMGGGLR